VIAPAPVIEPPQIGAHNGRYKPAPQGETMALRRHPQAHHPWAEPKAREPHEVFGSALAPEHDGRDYMFT
jgi:hypothetical protein